jgi:predicted site-specific integrase-resolvase
MVDSRYYNPTTASNVLEVDVEQVLRWIHSGELPAFNVAKSLDAKRPTWRIAEADLAKFLMARRSPTAPQPVVKQAKRPAPKRYV